MAEILIVDDDHHLRQGFQRLLDAEGYETRTAASAEEALNLMREKMPQCVVMDVRMPGMDGLEALKRMRALEGCPPVVIMTAYSTTETAIEATRLGAFDYMLKPFDIPQVLELLQRALAAGESQRRHEAQSAEEALGEEDDIRLVGHTPPMQELYKAIGRVAPTDALVLIRGESGTGKELVANAIWRYSPRSRRPFSVINCVAIPDTLLESELFGYEKGAFTGANKNGKRTALIYLLNDLFGLILWSIIFYTVNAIVHFGFMDMIMTPVSIAFLNTIFRVATVVVLFPFIPKLEKLVCYLVKDSAEELEDEADFDLLEERLLNYPALAIGQCHRAMNGMAKKLRKNVNRAMNLLNDYQQDKYDKVQRKEDLIDKYESRLGEYLIQLTKREMNTAQTRQTSLYLHTINDFERIGDHASYIAHMSNEMHDNHTNFSQTAWDELNVVMDAVREEINVTCNAFMNDDKEAAQRVAPLGVVITRLCDELKVRHAERLSEGQCGLEEGTVFSDILNSFGRIASHCASAMTALMKSGEDTSDIHIHNSKIYPSDSLEYYTYFKEYRQKYDIGSEVEHKLSMEPEEVE